MAVAYEMRFAGATLEQYEQVMVLMGRDGSPMDTLPDGALFHWVAKTDDASSSSTSGRPTSSSSGSPRSRSGRSPSRWASPARP